MSTKSIASLLPLALSVVMFSSAFATAGAQQVKLEGDLQATAAGGLASGKAKFESRAGRIKMSVQVEDAATNGAATVAIFRNGALVSSHTVNVALGGGDLNLDTNNGQSAPALQAGDEVQVTDAGGTLILTGTLAPK